jgi:hypothetical protein
VAAANNMYGVPVWILTIILSAYSGLCPSFIAKYSADFHSIILGLI